tara:strand:- start:1475 stop:2116 length:642 start_codon:yes stop_codon:yes gene_type:complete
MKFYNKKTWNDRWIIEVVFKGRKGGFFIEAGAQHGKWGSCTYALEKYLGWTGILVEPVNKHFNNLVENRPNSVHVNACLCDKNEEVDFIEYEKETGYSGIPQCWESKRLVNPETSLHKKTKKPGVTLERLLDDYGAPEVIDYLALDIERSESMVFSVFPFDRYTFKAISLEGGHGAFNTLMDSGYVRVNNPFCRQPWENYFIHEKWIEITYKV